MDTVTDPRTLTGDTIATGGGATRPRVKMPEASLRRLTDVVIALLLPMETRGGGTRTGTQLSPKGASLETDLGTEGRKIVVAVNDLLTGSDPHTEIAVPQDLLPIEIGLGPQEAGTGLRDLTDPEQGPDPDLPRELTDLAASVTMRSRTHHCLRK